MLFRKLAALFIVLAGTLGFASTRWPCDSVEGYRALLDHVAEASATPSTDMDDLIAEVPSECDLTVSGTEFHISLSQIDSELFAVKNASEAERPAKIQQLQNTIRQREQALDAYSTSVDPTAQPKLKDIFTRSEFRRVGTQNADAIFKEELLKLFTRFFSLIFRNPEEATFFAEVLIWTIVALIAAFIVWKLYRWATREGPAPRAREIQPFAPSAKSWQQWMNEARAAFANGALRDAIHLSYWAAISYLERSGAWTPDKARTPREYLRLISASNPARPQLAEISGVFEVVWYGQRTPSQSECQQFLDRVEQIACR